MTTAATRCNLTQGAVSHHIKALEDELGVSLFDRRKNDLQLTDYGKTMLKYARSIIQYDNECKAEIESMNGHLCGELRIGIGHFIAPYIRRVAIEFMKRHPDVLLHVHFDSASVLNKMLRDCEVDLAFTMNSAYHYEGIVSKPCIPFKLSAIMSKRHLLADKDIVTFDDLMKCRIVMPDIGERVFQTVQKYTPNNDLSKLPVSCIVSSASEALMVLDELGAVTFLPSDYTMTSRKLVAKPIETLDMELCSNAHWLREKPLKSSAKEFLNIIEEQKKYECQRS